MKTKKIIKGVLSLFIILLELVTLILFGYSLYLYNGVETFYRVYGIIILLYIFSVLAYSILKCCPKKELKGFIIAVVMSLLFSILQGIGYYYLTKVYNTINIYSKTENQYTSVLVSYNKKLKSYEDLKNMKIGLVNDSDDIEGNKLPLEIIEELKLDSSNTIEKYSSSIELLVALKENEIDAAFFSNNYVDMFYTLEGYENIKEETVVLYTKTKVFNVVEDTQDTTKSSFTEPFTMLFIGVDSSNDGVTSGYNADVLILVTFNPKTLQATMTSVPRDMYLKTACSGNTYRRINTTTWGSSSSCAVNTIENLFGVNVDYYAKINFKGVVQLVDSVGGIDVDVDYSLCDQNSNREWKYAVLVEKGQQHLDGEQALALARNRHKANDGSYEGEIMNTACPDFTEGERNDYTRGRNQLKVIMGIINAATKLTNVNDAIKILEDISSNFQTNIKSENVTGLYSLGKAMLFTDNASSLVNIQRMQLKGYNFKVYDINSKSYPSVTIPYTGSIDDIKAEINDNLNGSKESTKLSSFDLNNLYQDVVLGQDSYSQSKIPTLANVSGYSVNELNTYASNNNLSLKFIDVDTGSSVSLDSWNNYSFSYQDEHVDTIINQISTLTIYVKKTKTTTPEVSTKKDDEISTPKDNEVSTVDNVSKETSTE